MDIDQIIIDLQRQHDTLIQLPEKAFFTGISNYVSCIRRIKLPFVEKLNNAYNKEVIVEIHTLITKTSQLNNDSIGKNFTEVGYKLGTSFKYAWVRLRLIALIQNREKLDKLAKTLPEKFEAEHGAIGKFLLKITGNPLSQLQKELDETILPHEEGQIKTERILFRKDDYLNALTIVHEYIVKELLKLQNEQLLQPLYAPKDTIVAYEGEKIWIKLSSGKWESVDFSNAPLYKTVIETFWELREANPRGTAIFKNEDIYKKFKEVYKKIFNREPDNLHISSYIDNTRAKIEKKTVLLKHIIWKFERPDKWRFEFK